MQLFLSLDFDDMDEITTYLGDLSKDQIFQLGLSLGLNFHTLMETRDVAPQSRYLTDMLASWFRKQDKVLDKSGPPTWRSLAKALRSKSVRQNGIAAIIEQEKQL